MPTDGQIAVQSSSQSGERAIGSAHLVGACGAGMKALAELLDDLGWRLSGSDLSPVVRSIEVLCQRGFQFHQGHSADHVPAGTECLIYSPAVRPENPERMEAARRGLPQWSYSQMAGRLMQSRQGICVAGTHGKSTTTAMIGWVLNESGFDPSVLVGAELTGSGRSGRAGNGRFLVVESCEFNHSFLDFQPAHAAITNIETDHFDCYSNLPSLVQAFAEFANRVPADGVLLTNGDHAASVEAVRGARSHAISFGMQLQCDWRAANVVHSPGGTRFDVFHGGHSWGQVALRVPGDHNIQNALAAAALCTEIGVSVEAIQAGLSSFCGVKRRFEVVGEWKGMTLIDDYAHHPTAVRATLSTARQVYGQRRIRVVFQPHQVSRTMALMTEFAASFDDADEVVIAPVFAARETVTDEPERCSRELARRIAERGKPACFVESLDRIIPTVDDAARPGDVLIAMGAGDIDRIHYECIRSIR